MRPVRVTPPAELPVSLLEVKEEAIVDFHDDDALLSRLIQRATEHLDGYSGILGRCVVNQGWRQDFAGWASCLRLPFPNVSAAAIEYTDAAGNPQTLPAAQYELVEDGHGARIAFLDAFTWPALGEGSAPVRVTFTAGYGTAVEVPEDIKGVISMLAAYWFDPASDKSGATWRSVDALVDKHRWVAL